MKPVEFPERNYHIEEKGKAPAPMYKEAKNQKTGRIIFKLKPTFIERLRLMFGGHLWVMHATYHKPIQPTAYTTRRKTFFTPVPWRERVRRWVQGTTGANAIARPTGAQPNQGAINKPNK